MTAKDKEHKPSLEETAEREVEEKTPGEAVKDDLSKLVHGEDITSPEPSEARKKEREDN